MAQSESVVPRRGRWLKILGWTAAILLVLVVGLYFVVTSTGFFKGFILPRVGQSLNADITVSDAEISPFSHVILHDVKVTPHGAPTLFTAHAVTARYGLMSIIGGHILVEEASIQSPIVTVIANPDGTSNLTPLESTDKKSAATLEKSAPSAKSSKPPELDIRSVRLENATVRFTQKLADGKQEISEISPLTITLADLKNGANGRFEISSGLNVSKTNGVLQAKLTGSGTLHLNADLTPGAATSKMTFDISQATGDFAQIANLGAHLDCEMTPTEIKQLALSFTKAGVQQGQLLVSGPFDGSKSEGKLKVQILNIDHQVLNLAGAASGLDFGTTTINTTNEIELAKNGSIVNAAGSLDIAHLQILRQNESSPTLDLRCDYNVTVDQAAQSLTIKSLKLTGTEKNRSLLSMELSAPMTIAWGRNTNTVGDATLNLALNDLNLADWKSLAGESTPAGLANLKVKLLSQQGGQHLTFNLDGHLDHLSAQGLSPIDIRWQVNGDVAALTQCTLKQFQIDVTQQGQSVVVINGSGTFDQGSADADLQLSIKTALDRVATLAAQTNFTCRSGQLELTSHIVQHQKAQSLISHLALTGFTGQYANYQFDRFGTTIDMDAQTAGDQVTLKKLTGQFSAGGQFSATGQYDTARKTGQVDLKLVDLKENDLRPFLEPSLSGSKLISVTLNTSATAGITAAGDASVKADLHIANLVVQNPTNPVPTAPLELRLQADASAAKNVYTIHQCQLTLTPTSRADNQLQLSGAVDCTISNAITGNLKLVANALDLTAYYDLFVGSNKTSEASAPATLAKTEASAPANTNTVANLKEPDPVVLPVHNFTFSADIKHCYLRELDVTNFQTTVAMDGGHIVMKPFRLNLNGAPISLDADINLGVPGYQYDLTLTSTKIPLAPLVDSFSPTYSDKASGVMNINLHLKGAGTLGRSLKKTLSGKATFDLTNANVQIVGPRLKTFLRPIAFALNTPELLSTPLDSIFADIRFGSGQIDERRVVIHSALLLIETQGTIPIADVLNDSPLNQPIDLSLTKQLASRLHPNTPSEGYMKIPTLVTVIGTIGDPQTKTIADKAIEAVGSAVSTAASTVKQGFGKLFNSQSSTNAASTNSTFHPLSIFQKKN